jgi:hypothetical protein
MKMSKILPDIGAPLLKEGEEFQEAGILINRSLEGIEPEDARLEEEVNGVRVMRSLEFDMVPKEVAVKFNDKSSLLERKETIRGLYDDICKLRCVDCYAREDALFSGQYNLLLPDEVLGNIISASRDLGTKSIKFMGPGEMLRDPELFTHLDKLRSLDLIVGLFTKDPMLGDDQEAKKAFGHIGVKSSEDLSEKLSEYENLRILFNLRSFDEIIQNGLVGGNKKAYPLNYKKAQNRAIELLHKYMAKPEIERGKDSRLVIINAPIINATVDESLQIFTYFMDRGVPVISCASMQSGCGKSSYQSVDLEKLSDYYALVCKYAIEKGLTTFEEVKRQNPSAYAGMVDCLLSSNLLIRATGHVQRCPGKFDGWIEATPRSLKEEGIAEVWKNSKNYALGPVLNPGCPAKADIYNTDFSEEVIKKLERLIL